MKITLEENELNYIKNLLLSLPIRELDKVDKILGIIQQKENAASEASEEVQDLDS